MNRDGTRTAANRTLRSWTVTKEDTEDTIELGEALKEWKRDEGQNKRQVRQAGCHNDEAFRLRKDDGFRAHPTTQVLGDSKAQATDSWSVDFDEGVEQIGPGSRSLPPPCLSRSRTLVCITGISPTELDSDLLIKFSGVEKFYKLPTVFWPAFANGAKEHATSRISMPHLEEPCVCPDRKGGKFRGERNI